MRRFFVAVTLLGSLLFTNLCWADTFTEAGRTSIEALPKDNKLVEVTEGLLADDKIKLFMQNYYVEEKNGVKTDRCSYTITLHGPDTTLRVYAPGRNAFRFNLQKITTDAERIFYAITTKDSTSLYVYDKAAKQDYCIFTVPYNIVPKSDTAGIVVKNGKMYLYSKKNGQDSFAYSELFWDGKTKWLGYTPAASGSNFAAWIR